VSDVGLRYGTLTINEKYNGFRSHREISWLEEIKQIEALIFSYVFGYLCIQKGKTKNIVLELRTFVLKNRLSTNVPNLSWMFLILERIVMI